MLHLQNHVKTFHDLQELNRMICIQNGYIRVFDNAISLYSHIKHKHVATVRVSDIELNNILYINYIYRYISPFFYISDIVD